MEKQKIGILGSGIVARTLGTGFAGLEHEVMLGTRDPSRLSDWVSRSDGKIRTGSVQESAAFGKILVLASKGSASHTVLESAGMSNLSGKIIIDTTNPIADEPPEGGVLKFFTSLDKSLMEDLQESFAGARFVKAFSCVGNAHMVNPSFETRPTMFICGNDPEAKNTVNRILDDFGWDSEDFGGAVAARAIEPLCILWCIPGFQRNEWGHAFKMLKSK